MYLPRRPDNSVRRKTYRTNAMVFEQITADKRVLMRGRTTHPDRNGSGLGRRKIDNVDASKARTARPLPAPPVAFGGK